MSFKENNSTFITLNEPENNLMNLSEQDFTKFR